MRGLPSHGGGKRFDEEQWAVTGSARYAVAEMDLKELRGKRVQIVVNSVAGNGGATVDYPGLDKLTGGYNNSLTNTDFNGDNPIQPQFATPAFQDSKTKSAYQGATAGGEFSTRMRYIPQVFATDSDLEYLRAAIYMKCAHDGVFIATKDPDLILMVLVDVFGTNLSRRDSLVCWTDSLEARCDLTYYAQYVETGALAIAARRSSSEALYKEYSMIAFTGYTVERTVAARVPELMPVNAPGGMRLPEPAVATPSTPTADAPAPNAVPVRTTTTVAPQATAP